MLIKILKVLFVFDRGITGDYQDWGLVLHSLNQRCDCVGQPGAMCHCRNPKTTGGFRPTLRHQHGVSFMSRRD